MPLESLNHQHAIDTETTKVSFTEGEGGIPVIEIKNPHASASISLQGAQILSWIPEGEEEVVWLSSDATFAPGKSLRGGIPICWPWFGAHDSDASLPAHGFARTTMWHILSVEILEDDSTRLSFTNFADDHTRAMWPADTSIQYIVTIGKRLEMELITHNNGDSPIVIGQALHTYFNVGDIAETVVLGLENTDYLDKPDGFKRKHQIGAVVIEGEVDRIYLDTANDCIIDDSALKRQIIIIKSGSHSTVVWNPWREVADRMGDLGDEGYKHMLCVESCNAADDVVTIEAGKSHHLWVQYEVLRK